MPVQAVSRAERGRLGELRVDTIAAIAFALGARATIDLWIPGGEIARLLDEDHATLQQLVASSLARLGQEVAAEVSFSIYGERGSVDLLARHAPTRTLLVVEIKTDLLDVQDTVGTLDRKRRLALKIAADRGWDQANNVGTWLVFPESMRLRRKVDRFAALLGRAFPAHGHDMERWLRRPEGPIHALSFVRPPADPSSCVRSRRVRASARREASAPVVSASRTARCPVPGP